MLGLQLYSLRPSLEVCWECPSSGFLCVSLSSWVSWLQSTRHQHPLLLWPFPTSSGTRAALTWRFTEGWGGNRIELFGSWERRRELCVWTLTICDLNLDSLKQTFTLWDSLPLLFFYYPKRIVVFIPLALNYITLLSRHSQTYQFL